jgi:hypothetical protein
MGHLKPLSHPADHTQVTTFAQTEDRQGQIPLRTRRHPGRGFPGLLYFIVSGQSIRTSFNDYDCLAESFILNEFRTTTSDRKQPFLPHTITETEGDISISSE